MSVFQSVAPSNMLSSGLSVCARVGEPGQAAQCHDRLTKDPRVIQKDCPLYRSSCSFTDNTPLDVLLDTEKAERAMEERGITERAITAAMLSNGFELAVAFRKVDGRNCNDEDNS